MRVHLRHFTQRQLSILRVAVAERHGMAGLPASIITAATKRDADEMVDVGWLALEHGDYRLADGVSIQDSWLVADDL